MTYRYYQCLLLSVLMVVPFPFRGKYDLDVVNSLLNVFVSHVFEFCHYFDVLCCTFCQIDVLFLSMARCTIVSWWNKRFPCKNIQMHCCPFYLLKQKHNINQKSVCDRKSYHLEMFEILTPEVSETLRSHKIFFIEDVWCISIWHFVYNQE